MRLPSRRARLPVRRSASDGSVAPEGLIRVCVYCACDACVCNACVSRVYVGTVCVLVMCVPERAERVPCAAGGCCAEDGRRRASVVVVLLNSAVSPHGRAPAQAAPQPHPDLEEVPLVLCCAVQKEHVARTAARAVVVLR